MISNSNNALALTGVAQGEQRAIGGGLTPSAKIVAKTPMAGGADRIPVAGAGATRRTVFAEEDEVNACATVVIPDS